MSRSNSQRGGLSRKMSFSAFTTTSSSAKDNFYSYDQVKGLVNWTTQITNPILRKEFYQFNSNRQSNGFLLYCTLISTFFLVPWGIFALIYDLQLVVNERDVDDQEDWHIPVRLFLSIISLISMSSATCIGWKLYLRSTWDEPNEGLKFFKRVLGLTNSIFPEPNLSVSMNFSVMSGMSSKKSNSLPNNTKNINGSNNGASTSSTESVTFFDEYFNLSATYLTSAQLFHITMFLRRSLLMCYRIGPVTSGIAGSEACSRTHLTAEHVLNSALIMIFMQLLFFTNLPGVSVVVVWFNYALTSVIFVLMCLALDRPEALLMGLIILGTGYFTIVDIKIRNIMIFLTNRKLHQAISDNERMADENHANELRSMIANVAHDLKTVSEIHPSLPLSSTF